MTRYQTTRHNRRQRILSRIKELFSAARHFRIPHNELCDLKRDILTSDDAKRMTGPDAEFVRGYAEALYDAIWRKVQFHYVTERGYVGVSSKGENGGHLTSEECRRADDFDRGHAWPREPGQPWKWFTFTEATNKARNETN